MGALILNEIAFEGGHFIFSENRGIGAGPDIPDNILPFFPFLLILGVIALSGIVIQNIMQLLTAVFLPVNVHLQEISLFIHGHAAVVKKVGIVYLVQASLGKKETYMPLQLLPVHNRMAPPLHHLLFFLCQPVRVGRVNGGEIHVLHGIFRTVNGYRIFFIIYFVQKESVGHVEFRPFLNQLALQLELDDGNGFVHLHIQLHILHVVIFTVFDGKNTAV